MISTPKKRKSSTECQKVNSTNIDRHIQRDPITLTWLCCILNFFREQNNCKEFLTTSTMLGKLCFHETIISGTNFVNNCSLAIITSNKIDIETNLQL